MTPPDIFIILLDTLRRDRVRAYGCARDTSPNLDRFAKQAVRIERAYTSAPWTLPAHTSLFTGLSCEEHGVTSDLCTLGDGPPTLAERLAAGGYLCLGYSGNPFVGAIYGLARGFHRFVNAHELETAFTPPPDWQDAAATETDKGAADIVRRFGADLACVEAERRPLFAFFNFSEPHHPYYPPTPFRLRYWRALGEFDAATVAAVSAASELNFNLMTGRVALSGRGYELLRAWYDGGVRYADYRVGELLTLIHARRSAERALVIVLSDHGELLGERGILGHTWSVLDGVSHIPMLVRFPGQQQPASIAGLVQIQDVYATALRAAGLDPGLGRLVDLAALRADDGGRTAAITDRARIDNDGLTFRLLKNRFGDEYGDPHNPIHALIQPSAVLRSVVTAESKVNLAWSPLGRSIEHEWGGPLDPEEALERMRAAYREHCGRDVALDRVACHPRPGFDFMQELANAQVSQRLRDLGYVE